MTAVPKGKKHFKLGLPPIVDHRSRILILGTMPGEKSIAHRQYYANPGNCFWKILFEIFDERFSADYAVRLDLLRRHGIALWNTLSACERDGSADQNIRQATANDFKTFFKKHPKIGHIFFESKAAAKLYDRFCERHEQITYNILPSVSGLNARVPYAQKLYEWRRLAELVRNR